MKYFTKEWFSGKISDKKSETIKRNYWKYIDTIYSSLPFTLKLLSKHINLHDGKIVSLQINEKQQTIVMNVDCGDLQVGHFFIMLIYQGISEKQTCVSMSNSQIILSDEVEVLNQKKFCHRFLLTSHDEIEIVFQNLKLTIFES